MVDEAGNIVTSVERLQELSLQKLAVERLRDRDINEDLHEMRKEKEILCEQNLKKARENKTPDWSLKDVMFVLKNLKTGVSRDPLGLVNEIFNPKIASEEIVLAIMKLMNRIKSDQVFPDCFEPCNITRLNKH